MGPSLIGKIAELNARSRLNQNVIIDARGLRVGRKVWIERSLLPAAIQRSEVPLCAALRGRGDLGELLYQISRDADLLSGKKERGTYAGINVTSRFTRVLLLGPDFKKRPKDYFPSMGLERMAAYLRATNDAVDVETQDPTLFKEHEDLFRHIKNNPYDVIGLSTLTPSLGRDTEDLARIADICRGRSSRPILVMGNTGVLLGAEKLFNALPALDALVWGPGEYPLAVLVREIQKAGEQALMDEIDRRNVLENAATLATDYWPAKIALRGRVPYAHELFAAPTIGQLIESEGMLDFYAMPYEEYWSTYKGGSRPFINFHVSTASCPRHCSYCATPKGKLGLLPPDYVVRLFQHARAAYPGVTYYAYTDDNLFILKSHLMDIVERIRRTAEWDEIKNDILFYAQGRADDIHKLTDAELGLLYEAGFREIGIGAESFSDKTLIELNKHSSARVNAEAVRALDKTEIFSVVNLILFPPNISLKDLYSTIERSIEISGNSRVEIDTNMALLAFSGSPLTEAKSEKGMQDVLTRPTVKQALDQPWIKDTAIEYDNVNGLRIPGEFKIILPLMQKLCDAAKRLSESALAVTNSVKPSEYGRRGLMMLWAIIALVRKNASSFSDEAAGEGASVAAARSEILNEKLLEVLRKRYAKEADAIIAALDSIRIPEIN